MFDRKPLKPGFHIFVSVVSVVSVVRKKFIGQLQIYGNLSYKCSIQKKRPIQHFVQDRMNSICPMNFFRTTDTTDTTDTTIWKPGFNKSPDRVKKSIVKIYIQINRWENAEVFYRFKDRFWAKYLLVSKWHHKIDTRSGLLQNKRRFQLPRSITS